MVTLGTHFGPNEKKTILLKVKKSRRKIFIIIEKFNFEEIFFLTSAPKIDIPRVLIKEKNC